MVYTTECVRSIYLRKSKSVQIFSKVNLSLFKPYLPSSVTILKITSLNLHMVGIAYDVYGHERESLSNKDEPFTDELSTLLIPISAMLDKLVKIRFFLFV